jgi:hypothetical protein
MDVSTAIKQVDDYYFGRRTVRKTLIDYCREHVTVIPLTESTLRRKLFQYSADLTDSRLASLALRIRRIIGEG